MQTTKSELIIPNWSAPENIVAYTTTRIGGISSKPYDTFNLGEHVGDDIGNVLENRRRLREEYAFLPNEPWWLDQVHGTNVIKIGKDYGEAMRADASWTDIPGAVCVVMTADCLPVVFTDKQGSLVAVAHAGWRGLADGILEATIEKLPADPINLLAWMGPAIGPEKFEVGNEVRERFIAHDPLAAKAFSPVGEKWLADIYMLATMRLAAAGVVEISGGGFCTYLDEKRFYSYRREKQTGRMATVVCMKKPST